MQKGQIDTGVLRNFFDRIKDIGIIQRFFFWRKFLDSYILESYSELAKIESFLDETDKGERELIEEKRKLENSNDVLKGKIEEKTKVLFEKDKDISSLKKDIQTLIEDKKSLSNKLTEYRTNEGKNRDEFERRITEMAEMKKHYDELIKKIRDERENEIRQEQLKRENNWKEHESKVEETIRSVCSKYTVEYVPKNKYPHKGAPDNSIMIAGEYIIFDAKAPKADKPDQFRNYIKEQAEKLSKYARQDNVKKDIFLVVPTNTIESFPQKHINLGNYRVYIIAMDSIEPVILAMKMIENYQNVAELSPEEREKISQVIGRFANTAKRRIQIDHFFAEQSIKDLMECNSLPDEIRSGAVLVEKNTKLNPPQQRRSKETNLNTLLKYSKDIDKEGRHANINMDVDPKKIHDIPLDKKKRN